MNLDPFAKFSSNSDDQLNPKANKDIFVKPKAGGGGGLGRTRKPEEPLEPLEIPLEPVEAEPEKPKPTVILQNPKWEVEKVGFNEETDISVELNLPPEHAHKTKVTFELFAKTPQGPERMLQGEAHAGDGKAKCRVPIYIPKFKDPDGNSLQKVEYFFTAKHSESAPLDGSKAPKVIDEMADRLIESHILPDLTFATGKSFLDPSQAIALKDLCAKIKGWRDKHIDGKLAVFGHADAVGKEDFNKALSERRAKSVFGFLMKDAAAWSELDKEEKWNLASIQDLLRQLGHDPGASDNQDGPKTQAAVKAFQTKKGVPANGQADAATRKAMYQAYMDASNSLSLKTKDFDDINGHPTAGCSEFNLLEQTESASEANRRVTILLLKSNKNFPIHYPCQLGSLSACEAQIKKKTGERRRPSYRCFFYDSLVKEEKGGGKKSPAVGKLKFSGVADDDDVKQYVNLKTDGKDPSLGSERHIEVEVENAPDGTKVFWKVRADKANSKRNLPKAGAKPDSKGTLTEFKDGVAEIETTVKSGKASFTLVCGLAGGDAYTIGAGLEKGKDVTNFNVVNWRKAWYQISREKSLVLPALTHFLNAYKLAFVGMERTKDEVFEKRDAPARTFYPQWMVSPGGTDKEVAVIGSHNKAHYQAKLKVVAGENPKGHMVICQHQFDQGALSEKISKTLINSVSSTFTSPVSIFNPPLSGSLVSNGTWKSLAPVGHPDHGKAGVLSDSDIVIEKGRTKLEEYKIKLPVSAPVPGIGHEVSVSLRLQGVSGPFLGESDGNQILAVYDPQDIADFQNTLTHELGHTFNQTPDHGAQSQGLLDHPHQYRKHGGQGPHCSTIVIGGKDAKGVEVEVDNPDIPGTKMKVYESGVCVMFHSGPQPGCLNRFCDTCLPYVKATDFSDFGKA